MLTTNSRREDTVSLPITGTMPSAGSATNLTLPLDETVEQEILNDKVDKVPLKFFSLSKLGKISVVSNLKRMFPNPMVKK